MSTTSWIVVTALLFQIGNVIVAMMRGKIDLAFVGLIACMFAIGWLTSLARLKQKAPHD